MTTSVQDRGDALLAASAEVARLDLYEANRPVADFYANALAAAAKTGNHEDVPDLMIGLGVIADRAYYGGDDTLGEQVDAIAGRLYEAGLGR